ncbi:Bet v I domain [Macleaya cordata]|uniref:Bet v I domain n=1 Tax=Macleaya cordata TaxID=56857 RepID=A0A200R0T7_MACCD|nr:Bet v I domain [Macleaya cordata]
MGKIEVEVEVKSSADKFWEAITDSAVLFPKIFPEQYKSIEILEGDGKSVGSIRLLTYGEAIPIVTFAKEKIEVADEANKSLAYSVIDGELATLFKIFKASLQVVPKGDGSSVKWSLEFEKASEEVPDPDLTLELAVKTFNDLDAYLLKA